MSKPKLTLISADLHTIRMGRAHVLYELLWQDFDVTQTCFRPRQGALAALAWTGFAPGSLALPLASPAAPELAPCNRRWTRRNCVRCCLGAPGSAFSGLIPSR